MRHHLSFAVTTLSALAFSACDDGLDTTTHDPDPTGQGPAEEELGTIALALDAGDLPIDVLNAVITVTPTAGGASVVVERTFASLGVNELIRVAPATYNVNVAVMQEGDAAPAYTGQVSNVTVLAGQRSAVVVPLTPTGGVQIAVTLPTLGGEITCQPTVDFSGAQPELLRGVAGAQRVERGTDNVWRPTYYLWLCGASTCKMVKTSVVDGAKNPMWDPATAVATNLRGRSDVSGLWATGAGFFALDEENVWESPDGITWTLASRLPLPSFTIIPGTDSMGGQLRGCGVFVDDAVHRLCNVIDEYTPASGNANLMGLALASSPDGLLWDAFPPILDGVSDRVAMPEVRFVTTPRSRAGHPSWSENEQQLVATAAHGGVYHAIVAHMSASTFDGLWRPQVFAFDTYRSVDGESWVVRDADRKCAGGIPRPMNRAGWASFVVDGVLHIYYPTSATDLAHLTSAK